MTVDILDEATEGEVLALPADEPQLLALADRMLRELKDTRDERQANTTSRSYELERISNGYADLDRPLERREERLLGYLEQIAKALPLRGKKSRNLAWGTIGWTAQPRRLVVEDEAVTEEWVKQLSMDLANALLRKVVTLKLDKKALDHYWKEFGEIPAGCVVKEADEKFSAKPSEPHV